VLQGVAWVYLAFREKRSRPGGKARGRGCGPPTDIPEVGTVMGPHILMRGLPTSPNEPAGICSHGKGRGLRPLPEESDSSSASPSSYYSKHSQEVCFRMSGGGDWKGVPQRNTAPVSYLIEEFTGSKPVAPIITFKILYIKV